MSTSLRQQVLLYSRQKRQFFFAEKQDLPNYAVYFFSGKEKPLYILVGAGIVLFFSFFFYKSLWAAVFLWPLGVLSYLSLQKEKGEKRRWQLEMEFKDCMQSVSANLRAGYSVENAFEEALPDMEALYGHEALMVKELQHIRKGLVNNVPLEKLLLELGNRSFSGNIKEFGEVFSIARASGGNLPEVLQSTAGLIGEKIALKQELQVMISGRRLEQNIMNVIPFLLVCYLEISNKGFFDVLYQDLFGRVIMTGCMLLYLVAYFLARKICRIEWR